MTDPFDKRARAFENKKSREADLHFMNKVEAVRRLGFSVAKQFGFDEQTTREYSRNLIDNGLVTGGLKDVVAMVVKDFDKFGLQGDAKAIEYKVRTYLAELDAEDGLTR